MADLSKLAKRRLGPPPAPDEASTTLSAPETAPAAPTHVEIKPKRHDGRRSRRTGRTIQFATRVSEAFDNRFRAIAERDGLLFTELLERSLEAYEKQR